MGAAPADAALHDALAFSQRVGMLGDRPIAEVIDHAGAFVGALADVVGVVVDLGSGGGVPGLVIAWRRPDLHVVLVDRRTTRTDHLRRLVRRLELDDRVEVATADVSASGGQAGQAGRAVPVGIPGRDGCRRPPADAVVARGFGPPAQVAVVGARLVRPGGLLVVSEPPTDARDAPRWPAELLDAAGLRRRAWPDRRVAVLERVSRET